MTRLGEQDVAQLRAVRHVWLRYDGQIGVIR
jgi:hypothetical protein